jgi:hypothetical protein
MNESMKEIDKLRRKQSARVMRVISPLLDAWEAVPNDVKSDPELKEFLEYMRKLFRAMEG